MYKLFLTLRYLSRKWIAMFAIMSVWLCVAMVLIVFSVMDGFLDKVKQHSRGLLSDIIVDNARLQGFPLYDEFADHLARELPDVVKYTTPVIYNFAIMRIKNNSYTKPVRVVGIKLEDYCKLNTFRSALFYDRYYPGTTTLGDFAMPIAGLKALPPAGLSGSTGLDALSGRDAVLPPEYEAAFAKYLAENPAHFEDEDHTPRLSAPHGVGEFEQYFETPTYADDPRPGVVIGTDVIFQRDRDGVYNRWALPRAEIVMTVLPLTPRGTIAEDPVPVAMRFVDDARTGVYDIDSFCAYMDFESLQGLLSMGRLERIDGTYTLPRASQLLVSLQDGVDFRAARDEIAAAWDSFLGELPFRLNLDDIQMLREVIVETWEQRQQNFIRAVETEKVLVTVLFGIISLVAIVLIGVVFHMTVVQKTRDIGIIKSLGATRAGVASIFLLYAAAVGLIGGVLGCVTGSIFVYYINEIQDALARFNPNLQVWSPDVYTFDQIPNVVKPTVVAVTFVTAILTAMVGAVGPALKAASIWPVQALRYE